MTTKTAADTKYLRPVPNGTVTLPPSDGSRLISAASDVFDYIDPDFVGYDANEAGADTPATGATVLEMYEEDADFETMFGSVAENVDTLRFTQSQIIGFCEKHRNLLRDDGWATFFLFKSKGKFFVASVGVVGGGSLEVFVFRFSYGYVRHAGRRRRVVVPQMS